MKRQFMKSLMALCTGVMTLVAASSLFVSCYDDSALRESVNKLDKRLQVVEKLKADLDALTAKVNGLYTLQFDVTSEGKVQYSFDGKTWTTTDIVLASGEECQCPAVSIVDNGDTVTVKIGDAELTLEKPQEIVFELRAGKVYFLSETTSTVAIKSSGIEDLSVLSAPKGWYAEVGSDGLLYITAPDYNSTLNYDPETYDDVVPTAAATGFVKVHACSADGKCMVGKVAVEVAEKALVVKAGAGKASYTMITESRWGNEFYYGISTKEAYEAEVKALVDAITNMNWDALDAYNYSSGDAVELSIAEALGTELEVGQEYVAWALVDGYQVSVADAVLAFYTHYSVEVTEVEEERAANNVTVNVAIEGLDSYVAVAIPGMYCDDPDYTKEMMISSLTEGYYYGKLMTESYTGGVLEIADGTEYNMGGMYTPECVCYLFILPLDGRPVVDYTPADVLMYEYQTLGLTAGGSVDVIATKATEYDTMVWDYNISDMVAKHVVVNPYSEVAVNVSFSSENWETFYCMFLDAETYAAVEGDDEVLVSLLLEEYGMTPSDIYDYASWPCLPKTIGPDAKTYFVAMAVDADWKYGQVAKVELATEHLEWAQVMWDGAYATNLDSDNILKNNTTFEFTPQLSENVLSYKYIWENVTDWNRYGSYDDASMAEAIFFSNSAVTVAAEDLVDGKIVVNGNNYSNEYLFAVIPVTEEGPGCSAAMITYSCAIEIANVVTSGASFEATEPEVVINLPARFTVNDTYDDDQFWGYEINSFNGSLQYYYQFNYEVTAVEGTTVCAVLVDTEYLEISEDAAANANNVWQGNYYDWYTFTTTDYLVTDTRYFTCEDPTVAPALYLCVSWTDADGNYYYKQYDLQKELQKLYFDMTPDGKQWVYNWTAMGMGDMNGVLDFGVTAPGMCFVAYDPAVLGAPEGTPYQLYNGAGYSFVPTDATSGKLIISMQDHFGDIVSQEFEYTNYTGESCTFLFGEMFIGQDAEATLTEVVVESNGGIM